MAARAKRELPRIEYLRVRNFRALKDFELKEITPLTVLLGPNGSGKSTIFDVFAFLKQCFDSGLRKAFDDRNGFTELRTRGADGPIEIEIGYREDRAAPLIAYHISIGEHRRRMVIEHEWVQWSRKGGGKPFRFLEFKHGKGQVISGKEPDEKAVRESETLDSPDILAVNTLGAFSRHPRVSALRRFIMSWHLSYLSAANTRGIPQAGPQEKLSQTGDNLPNVIQFLREQHPKRLKEILTTLSARVPRLERVDAKVMEDGRLLLQIKDAPFSKPVQAKFASDGTLKMLAYLTVLNDPNPPHFVGIEEPENQLHPRLLPELAEECQEATERTQMFVSTHSPFFVNALAPKELWILERDDNGFTQAKRAADIQGINEFMKHGAKLGHLWMEGHFEFGDPLSSSHKRGGAAQMRLEVLVEEESSRIVLQALLTKLLKANHSFNILTYQGKGDLIAKLPSRLAAYKSLSAQTDLRVLVVVDRDQDDCQQLKAVIEKSFAKAGISTLTTTRGKQKTPQAATRIAVEELESWYLGDSTALQAAYPKAFKSIPRKLLKGNPDLIGKSTKETIKSILNKAGVNHGQIRIAREMAAHISTVGNRSTSFGHFRRAVQILMQ